MSDFPLNNALDLYRALTDEILRYHVDGLEQMKLVVHASDGEPWAVLGVQVNLDGKSQPKEFILSVGPAEPTL